MNYSSKDHNVENTYFYIIILAGCLMLVFLISSLKRRNENYGFNNSEYQYSNPNVRKQYDYYKCIANQCAGETHDYPCLSMCHMKTFRKGMQSPDIKDLVCSPHLDDPPRYYECLEDVYNDYKYP